MEKQDRRRVCPGFRLVFVWFSSWFSSSQQNVSILKHFGFGPDGKYRFELGGEFYDVFNRHYYNAPDTYMGDSTFGDVRTVNGVNRVGQLRARFQF